MEELACFRTVPLTDLLHPLKEDQTKNKIKRSLETCMDQLRGTVVEGVWGQILKLPPCLVVRDFKYQSVGSGGAGGVSHK